MDVARETPDVTTKPKCYDLTKILVRVSPRAATWSAWPRPEAARRWRAPAERSAALRTGRDQEPGSRPSGCHLHPTGSGKNFSQSKYRSPDLIFHKAGLNMGQNDVRLAICSVPRKKHSKRFPLKLPYLAASNYPWNPLESLQPLWNLWKPSRNPKARGKARRLRAKEDKPCTQGKWGGKSARGETAWLEDGSTVAIMSCGPLAPMHGVDVYAHNVSKAANTVFQVMQILGV